MERLKSVRALIVDMDGVLYRGDMPLPGLCPFFDFIREQGIRFQLVTNNSTLTPAMYVAKMAGQASRYDLFTPDAGELAFLADEAAPHPFYTRGFILHEEDRVPRLIERAYGHKNASGILMVKGRTDYAADSGGIIGTVDFPSVPALEAIGGTGDTLTGIVSALVSSGMDLTKACLKAFRINRLAGLLADPDPSTQVDRIIEYIPEAMEEESKG